MSPDKPAQLASCKPLRVRPPSWISTTITSAPCARRGAISALALAASSSNASPRTPLGRTMCGVFFSVRPMKPTPMRTPSCSKNRMPVAGSSGRPSARTVLAARY